MILDLNAEGRVVLREIPKEVLDYIERERLLNRGGTWCFSNQDYDGTMYITSQLYESKEQALVMIDKLNEKYGLEMTESAKQIVEAWRAGVEFIERYKLFSEREEGLRKRVDDLKYILKEGCKGCINFAFDGDCGRCKADGGELNETPLSFENGAYDRNGVWHVGQKFYPHEGCIFLTEGLE